MLLPQCTADQTQAGGGGIMHWGTFSWASLLLAVVIKQTLNATKCINIISGQLHPYISSVFPTENRMFQQDNAPFHKARIMLKRFEEHEAEF